MIMIRHQPLVYGSKFLLKPTSSVIPPTGATFVAICLVTGVTHASMAGIHEKQNKQLGSASIYKLHLCSILSGISQNILFHLK